MSQFRSSVTGALSVSLLVALSAVSAAPASHAIASEPEVLFIRTTIGGVGGTLYRAPVSAGGTAAAYPLERMCPCFGTAGGWSAPPTQP